MLTDVQEIKIAEYYVYQGKKLQLFLYVIMLIYKIFSIVEAYMIQLPISDIFLNN